MKRTQKKAILTSDSIVIGLDIGIYNTKATLLHKSRKEIVNVLVPARLNSAEETARRAVDQVKQKTKVVENPYRTLATGYGKSLISFADDTVSDAVCLARGINEVIPSVCTLMDLGVQKTLVVKCSDGYPKKMSISDKCASGSGSYLEVVSNILEMDFEQMGRISLQSTEYIEIESMCAVFVESEIISLLHSKKKVEDILKAVYRSLAKRLHSLLLQIDINDDLALVGGMANDIGLRAAIEEELGKKIIVPSDPLFIGSLGAALIAKDNMEEDSKNDHCRC